MIVDRVAGQAERQGGQLRQHVGLQPPRRAVHHLLLAAQHRVARLGHDAFLPAKKRRETIDLSRARIETPREPKQAPHETNRVDWFRCSSKSTISAVMSLTVMTT